MSQSNDAVSMEGTERTSHEHIQLLCLFPFFPAGSLCFLPCVAYGPSRDYELHPGVCLEAEVFGVGKGML